MADFPSLTPQARTYTLERLLRLIQIRFQEIMCA